MSDARVGNVLCGRYEVSERIGEGAVARVYRGVDRRLGRPVVLKVMREDRVDDAELRERFAREARNSARLAHAHITKVHDVDDESGLPFIILEHQAARDLRSLLDEAGRLSPERACAIALDILDALDYAHGQGIIHRDLKPHNVLITDRDEVKITDFGIAKAVTSDSLTRSGAMIGTAHYMSPEQAQGQEVGPQTDLYALGVVLYEMLSGRLPFEGDNPITVALKHVQEPPPALVSRGGAVPPALERVVMTALSKSPDARYADARAMERALRAAMDTAGAASAALTPAVGALTSAGGAPPSTSVGAAAPRAMPTYALADSGEFRVVPPIPPPPPVEPSPSGARSAIILLLTLLCLSGVVYAAYVWVKPPGEVAVPSLVGLEESVARAAVERLNLRLTIKEFVYSDDPAGVVKSQSPPPGTSLRRGTDVLVVVSKGHQTVQIPSLVGLDREGARRALEERGLAVRWEEDFSERVPLGRVALQDPLAGGAAELGTRVTVTISKGMPQVTAPALLGIAIKDATPRAEALGLKVRVVTQKPSATVGEGCVLEQTPHAGARVAKGSTVELIVSSGPESRSVPSLSGMTLADARRTAEQQGFSVVVEGGGGDADSRIIEQAPEGGETMPQGGAIHVTIDVPPPTPVSGDDAGVVPNVRGMGLEAARATLEERGLRLGNTVSEESDLPSGTVLRQTPEDGAPARKGGAVDLVVSEKRAEPPNK